MEIDPAAKVVRTSKGNEWEYVPFWMGVPELTGRAGMISWSSRRGQAQDYHRTCRWSVQRLPRVRSFSPARAPPALHLSPPADIRHQLNPSRAGVFVYRNIADLEKIMDYADQEHVTRASVVGGGVRSLACALPTQLIPSPHAAPRTRSRQSRLRHAHDPRRLYPHPPELPSQPPTRRLSRRACPPQDREHGGPSAYAMPTYRDRKSVV